MDKALGSEGLFGHSANSAVRGEVPETLRSVVVAQLDSLFGGRAEEVWSTSGIRHPIYAGFRNPSARMSFAASVCQVLLRIPSFAVFLQVHVGVCQRKVAGNCVACLLHATRDNLRGKDSDFLHVLK